MRYVEESTVPSALRNCDDVPPVLTKLEAVIIPEELMLVALALPRTGVTSVGEVANTREPLPVSSVTADAKLADDGVARKVNTPLPAPVRDDNG